MSRTDDVSIGHASIISDLIIRHWISLPTPEHFVAPLRNHTKSCGEKFGFRTRKHFLFLHKGAIRHVSLVGLWNRHGYSPCFVEVSH